MKFESIIEEITRQKNYAADSLEDASPQTINARRSRKDNAKARLDELFFSYRQEVRQRIFAIMVIGDGTDSFDAIAESKTGLNSLEGDALYDALASKLDSRLLEKGERNAYILDVASRYIEDAAIDMGIKSYNQLTYKQSYDGKTTSVSEAKNLIKKAMVEQIGEEMNALFILDTASRLAFSEDFSGKIYPIMIKVRNENSLQELTSSLSSFGIRSILVATGDAKPGKDGIKIKEINEESVMDVLKKIKQKASKGQ